MTLPGEVYMLLRYMHAFHDSGPKANWTTGGSPASICSGVSHAPHEQNKAQALPAELMNGRVGTPPPVTVLSCEH